ncbi:MAG: response regulator [Prevotella sp.]|nr:response regulator [Prevotella sp.]
MKKSLFTLFLLLLWAGITQAQPACRVHTFTIRDGLAANTISGFGQTSDDLMWFATWNGMSCYDGYNFMTFRDGNSDADQLTSNRILLVKPNSQNDLWCTSYDRHLYLFDTHACQYVDVGEQLKEICGEEVRVRTIFTLANGRSWVVCRDEGIYNFCIDDSLVKTGGGITVYAADGKAFRGKHIHKVLLDDDGREWIFTEQGATLLGKDFHTQVVYDYMLQLGKTILLAAPTGQMGLWCEGWSKEKTVSTPAEVTRINDLVKLDGNSAVAATDGGLLLFDVRQPGSLRLLSVGGAEALSVFPDRSQRLWVFTKQDGVTVVDTRDWSQLPLPSVSVSPLLETKSEVPVFHQDSYGTVWLIPTGGTFCYYDETAKRLVPYILQTPGAVDAYALETGRSNTDLPIITKYMSDQQGNLWFTGTRALTLLNFMYRRYAFTLVVPNQEARSVCIDSKGNTWIGMYTGEVAVVDKAQQISGYLAPNGAIQSSPVKFSNRIYCIHEDRNGNLWIGTRGEGLFCRTAEGRVTHYTHMDELWALSSDDIYGFDEDSHGRLWIATYGGGPNILLPAEDGKVKFLHPMNGMKGYPKEECLKVRRITHDRHGVMLLSTNDGLLTMRDDCKEGKPVQCYRTRHVQGNQESLITNDVLQVLRLKDDSMMVVTQGGGVQMITSPLLQDNLHMRAIAQLNDIEGLPQSLLEDGNGLVWVIRENSIDRYNRQTGKVESFGPHELGDRLKFSEAQPVRNEQTGNLVLAAMGGAMTLQPAAMKKSDFHPQIVFTGVQFQGEEKVVPILNADRLQVASDQRNLTIFFSALDYTDNEKVQYAYKIEGEDEDWNFVGSAHSASFNHLPNGHLRLLVKSTNSDGVWIDNIAVLEIDSAPTFWETWWAKLLYLLIFAGIVYVCIYIWQLHTRNKMERELSDMKTRFFTDVSHKLRTPLTLIGGPVAEVLDKEKLGEGSRKLLEMVERNSQRMLALVNRMLTYSREKEVYISDTSVAGELVSDEAKDSVNTPIPPNDQTTNLPNDETTNSPNDQTLLIVEDNDDLRAFLVSILRENYRVLQAANGQEGLEKAEQEMPDFIITDVMMPVMDGLTMVHCIKQNKDICHIPIIVLSAKASMEDRLQGLREGIDDYITKPFSATYLKQRVENIIAGRRLLQQTYLERLEWHDAETSTIDLTSNSQNRGGSPSTPDAQHYRLDAPQIVDADKEMMERLMAYLEEHIGDADLRIEDLADAVNLGRSVFYGKVKSVVGMTPVDFVRHLRIQRAEQLVVKSKSSFSEIAYSVGFSDPKYFSKCFKKETGMTPSEYRQQREHC